MTAGPVATGSNSSSLTSERDHFAGVRAFAPHDFRETRRENGIAFLELRVRELQLLVALGDRDLHNRALG